MVAIVGSGVGVIRKQHMRSNLIRQRKKTNLVVHAKSLTRKLIRTKFNVKRVMRGIFNFISNKECEIICDLEGELKTHHAVCRFDSYALSSPKYLLGKTSPDKKKVEEDTGNVSDNEGKAEVKTKRIK